MANFKNICIVTSSYPTKQNTSEAAIIPYYADAIKKLGYKVYIFMPYRKGDLIISKGIEAFRFKYGKEYSRSLVTSKLYNPFHLLPVLRMVFMANKSLYKFCMDKKIDYCIAVWAIPAGFWTLINKRKLKIPYAVWSLGSDIHTWPKYPIARSIIKSVLKNASHRFADGIGLAEQAEKLSKKRCGYLPTTTLYEKNKIKKIKIKIDKKKFNFLYVGRWEKVKGVDILVKAIKLYFENGFDADFYLLGGGSLLKPLSEKIQKYIWKKNVYIIGMTQREEVDAYMQECDCLIIPSRKESIPYVFSEALRSKLPILSTEAGDMGYLIKRYKVGIAVKLKNPMELMIGMNRMKEFIKNKKVSYSGQKKLYGFFNIDRAVKNVITILKEENKSELSGKP